MASAQRTHTDRGLGTFNLARLGLIFGPTAALTVGAVVWVDAWLAQQPFLQFGTWLHTLSIQLTELGRAELYYFIFALGLGFSFFKLQRLKAQAGLDSIESWQSWFAVFAAGLIGLVATGIGVQIAKHAIGRARPYAEVALTGRFFKPLTVNYEFHSLPSGHAQVLFSFAAFLCFLVQERLIFAGQGNGTIRKFIAFAILAAAALLTLTRVFTLNHWLSDVIVGAMLGFVGTQQIMLRIFPKVRAKLVAGNSQLGNRL